jgi:hypothetical protein
MVEMEQAVGGVVLLVLVVVGAYFLYRGFGNLQTGWTIWQNDPVDAGAVAGEDGVVEVQGEVEQLEAELLTTKYSETPVVAYEYRREEKQRRPGDDREDEKEWRTVERGTESQPFYVTDETGSVAIDPDGATVSLDAAQLSGGVSADIGGIEASTSKEFEGRLGPGDQVHVYGQKRDAQGDGLGGERFYIGDGADTFTVSDSTEFRTSLRFLGKGLLFVLLGLGAFGVGAIVSLVVLGQLDPSQLDPSQLGLAFGLLARPHG